MRALKVKSQRGDVGRDAHQAEECSFLCDGVISRAELLRGALDKCCLAMGSGVDENPRVVEGIPQPGGSSMGLGLWDPPGSAGTLSPGCTEKLPGKQRGA